MRLALAGDTMLGRAVAERLAEVPPSSLVAEEVVEAAREADVFVLNLECCVSDRGRAWPDPRKPFFFRAPPHAVELLVHLGVRCVTLANNHVLDYSEEALVDTFEHLRGAGIGWAGAGVDLESAREPAVVGGLTVVACADHPRDYGAAAGRPGIALDGPWVEEAVAEASPPVLVSPHWGPNMVAEPIERVRARARELVGGGVTLVAGHSAHVFHGVALPVLYDLGDFLDDYAVHPRLRNDLGLLWLVELDAAGPSAVEAVPLKLEFCYTRVADGDDAAWIERRFAAACAAVGSEVAVERGRLVVRRR
jgi:poly-gamma-glutamate capsule biosynthesis protein CapA/YwtB (metallophosphatase superfamily)